MADKNIKIVQSNRIRREIRKSGSPSADGSKTVFHTSEWVLYDQEGKPYNKFYHWPQVDRPSRSRVIDPLESKKRSRLPEHTLKPIAIIINVVLILIILVSLFW